MKVPKTTKKILSTLSLGLIIAMLVFPFISYAVSATEMKALEITETTALITGKLLTPTSQSIKIGTIEQNNPQASFVFTTPFALGANNVFSKQLSGLAANTTYCTRVVDASDASNSEIFGSKICFTTNTPGQSTGGTKTVSVNLDTQAATDTGATLTFSITTGTGPIGLSIKYGVEPGVYTTKVGEFYRATTPEQGVLKKTAEIKNLTKNTYYYYQVYNTDTDLGYFDSFFKTAPAAGVVLNSGDGVNASVTPGCIPGQYCLLAPLPNLSSIDLKNTSVGYYIKIIFKIAIALAGILSVVMLVIGGIQYMASDAFTEKKDAVSRIGNAVVGLLLVLGAYMLLNTLNPTLTLLNFDLDKQSLSIDEMQFDKTEVAVAKTEGYTIAGTSFSSPKPGEGVKDFVDKLKSGYKLEAIEVSTSQQIASFKAYDASGKFASVVVGINIGSAGASEIGQGKEGDNKTPKGTTHINGDRRISTSLDKAVTSNSGKYNLGAAFINIGTNPDRGIGFHGKYNNQLGVTNGCIRMSNDNLIVLAPYMVTGVEVWIY